MLMRAIMSLRRELGLFQIVAAGVGMILGAGIYALIGIAAGKAGNATWLSFLIAAIIALLTGISYAELSSKFKGDSGEYSYIASTMNKPLAIFVGVTMILAGIVSAATVALGFGGYVSELIPVPIWIGAALLLAIMSLINFIGIRESSWFNLVSTIIEFIGLVIIIIIAIPNVGKVNLLDMPFGFNGVLQGAALVFFAFMGFESMIKLREEAKNPQRTIPRGMMYAILITTLLYVTVAIAAVNLLSWNGLASSHAPLASAAAFHVGAWMFVMIGIIALFSTSNTVLMTMVTTSRMIYGMAKRNSLPLAFSKVHKKRKTPHLAIGIVLLVSIAFMTIGNLSIVATIANLLLFVVFAFVNLSLILVRYKFNNNHGEFRAPFNIGKFSITALFGVLTSLGMIVFILLEFI